MLPTLKSSFTGAGGQSRHMLHQVVTQYNRDTNALIRRRIRVGAGGAAAIGGALAGGGGLVQLRIPPPPLPLSWGRTVRPYVPPEPMPPPEPLEGKPVEATAATAAPAASKEAVAAEGADGVAADVAAAAVAAAAAEAAAAACRGYEAADLTRFPFDKALGGEPVGLSGGNGLECGRADRCWLWPGLCSRQPAGAQLPRLAIRIRSCGLLPAPSNVALDQGSLVPAHHLPPDRLSSRVLRFAPFLASCPAPCFRVHQPRLSP